MLRQLTIVQAAINLKLTLGLQCEISLIKKDRVPFVTSISFSSSTEVSECFICRDVELPASDPLRNFCDCKNLLAHHVCLSTWIQRVRRTFHAGNLDILNFSLAGFPHQPFVKIWWGGNVCVEQWINVFAMLAFLIETKRRCSPQGNELPFK